MQALAKLVGVRAWQTIQQWEKEEGGTAPKRDRLTAVASILQTTPEYLMFGDGSPQTTVLTTPHEEDAQRLMKYFKAWQASQKEQGRPSSKAEAASRLEIGQSALTQYIRGEIPLNLMALKKFCALLGVEPASISPKLAVELQALAALPAVVGNWPFSRVTRDQWRSLPETVRAEAAALAEGVALGWLRINRPTSAGTL